MKTYIIQTTSGDLRIRARSKSEMLGVLSDMASKGEVTKEDLGGHPQCEVEITELVGTIYLHQLGL